MLECPEVTSALKRSGDFLDEVTQRRQSEAFVACAERLADDGVDLDGYTLADRVEDLEAARIALGYDRINLVPRQATFARFVSWRRVVSWALRLRQRM